MNEDQPLELVKRMKVLADTGLVFTQYGFDREDATFFKVGDLPLLSEDRIVGPQWGLIYGLVNDKTAKCLF